MTLSTREMQVTPEAITAAPAGTAAPDARPPRLAGTFLVDAHVHCHDGRDPGACLDQAARNLAAAAGRLGTGPAAGWLLFTETAGADVFADLRAGRQRPAGWHLEATAEAVSLRAEGPHAFPLILVAGRQIVTAEGLEVLALCTSGPLAEGLDLGASVAAVRAAGGIPVIPWGFGKWWGARGRVLARFLEQAAPGSVFLGDSAGRPAHLPPPRLFARAAKRGIAVLPGSDPLPLAADAGKVGRYGFVLEGAVDPARPAEGLKRLLAGRTTSPPAFGRRERPLAFAARQLAMQRQKRRHHGLAHDVLTPDLETASEAYARRFAGPVGAWLLEVQQGAVLRLLPPGRLCILEVGGGHGQLTAALLEVGHEVVVHGSRPECADRIGPLLEQHPDRLAFVTASLWQLPFAERRFDAVIGLRLLAHVERADELLAEMARLARSTVIVDFPPKLGANLLEPVLFRAKRALEGNTRPFFAYRTRDLVRPLTAAGFAEVRIERQLFWPMVLHRRLGRRRLAEALEAAPRALGLTRRLGAPALLAARRAGAPGEAP